MIPVIAIDGPTASGKGTIAQAVADVLGYRYLDSGAIYRLTALDAMQRGLSLVDSKALAQCANGLDIAFADGRIWLAGAEVTDAIRAENVGIAASEIGVHPQVREALLDRQRAFRTAPGLVADGRDMGTVVFPDAPLKVYLTASVAARADRRTKQLMTKGIFANIDILSRDLQERDVRDMSRSSAPLIADKDAVTIDSSDIGVAEVVQQVVDLARSRGM